MKFSGAAAAGGGLGPAHQHSTQCIRIRGLSSPFLRDLHRKKSDLMTPCCLFLRWEMQPPLLTTLLLVFACLLPQAESQCREAKLPYGNCAGYQSCGYSCSGSWCAVRNCASTYPCTCTTCSYAAGNAYVVDASIGRCVCPAGSSCPNRDTAVPCPAGSYCPSSVTGTPVLCPLGSWSAGGSATCTACPSGTYGTTQGATSSSSCLSCAAVRKYSPLSHPLPCCNCKDTRFNPTQTLSPLPPLPNYSHSFCAGHLQPKHWKKRVLELRRGA